MATFEITGPDGAKYQVDGPDAEGALRALQQHLGTAQQQATATPQTPLDKMQDPAYREKYMAEHPNLFKDTNSMGTAGDAAATLLQGVPFVGEYADEALGKLSSLFGPNTADTATQAIRSGQERFQRENPKTSLGLKVGGGIAGALPAAAYMPAIGPTSLLGKVAVGVPTGAALGGAEGLVSGYGAGTSPATRMDQAQDRGLMGGLLGGVLGGAVPFAVEGLKKGGRAIMDQFTLAERAKQAGLSKPSYEILTRAMDADGSLNGTGMRNINAAGSQAMLADAGPAAQTILDTAIQKGNKAAVVAKDAVEQRASRADQVMRQALDSTLGKPQGIKGVAKDISQSTSAARSAAYKNAYQQPIDYSAAEGKAVEDLLKRIPGRYLGGAIQKANELMQWEGVKNQQIMAQIAPDGTVNIKEMPNVLQLDYIKRALNAVAEGSRDDFGRLKPDGLLPADAAKEVRSALGNAVPEYGMATRLGGDKIAEDNALRLGTKLFDPSTTREDVAKATRGMGVAERTRLANGLRQHVDDILANVKVALTDPNMDAREAVKMVKEFSSRANREKLRMAIGDRNANTLLSVIDTQTKALNLRAAVAQNSKTFPRQTMDQTIKQMNEPGFWATLGQGKPLEAPKRLMQRMTNQAPEALQAREDKVYEELARALTGPRGADAMSLLGNLQYIAQRAPENAEAAQFLGSLLGYGALGPAAYRTGMQLLGTSETSHTPAAR